MPSTDREFIALAEAVDRYRCEAGYCNAYSTLRAHAAEWGRVYLGEYTPALKVRGRWVVRRSDLSVGQVITASPIAPGKLLSADYHKCQVFGSGFPQPNIDPAWLSCCLLPEGRTTLIP